jgi:hypothetical protein
MSSGEFIGNDKHSVEERPREVGVFSKCEVKLRTRNQPSNVDIDKISATLFGTLVDDGILIVQVDPEKPKKVTPKMKLRIQLRIPIRLMIVIED